MSILKKCVLILILLLSANQAQALIISMEVGADGVFRWEQLPSGEIQFDINNSGSGNWLLETNVDTYVDIYLMDCCTVGDAFDLYLNGVYLPPSRSDFLAVDDLGGGNVVENLFQAWYDDVFLRGGTQHVIDIQLASGSAGSGQGYFSFSGGFPAEVPEPQTAFIFLLGILVFLLQKYAVREIQVYKSC